MTKTAGIVTSRNLAAHGTGLAHGLRAASTAIHAAVLACLMAATAAHAQIRPFDVPAQPLDTALAQIARQAGLQLLLPPELAQGRQAPAVRGELDAHDAISAALAGSGLEAVRDGQTVVVRRRAAVAGGVPGTLAEVVVTAPASGITEGSGSYTTGSTSAATGLNLSLRETPQSITVVTQQRMDDQNLNSLGQVLAQVPGLSVSGSNAQSTDALTPVYSRGYLLSRFQVDGATATVYSSGWYGFNLIDTALYDSVAVVRGPTGLLTGDGDPSGSVNLVRKRPTDSFQASLSGTIGRWDQYRAVADVGGPLNEAGTLRARVVAFHDEGKSWVDRQEHDKNAAYAVLDADLSNATLLSLALEHHRGKFKGHGRNGIPVISADDGTATPFSRSDNATADWSYEDQKKTVASLALEHRFNDDWQVKARYGYTSLETSGKYALILGVDSDGTISTLRPSRHIEPTTYRSHDLDLRLDGRYTLLGRQHDLVAGFNGYSKRDANHRNFLRFSASTANALEWAGNYPEPDWSGIAEISNKTDTEQHGLFLATRLRPTDDLSVILGGRLSTWKTKAVNRLTGATTDDRKENSIFTPYAGVVYDLNPSLSAYASYTEIFNPQSYKDASGTILDPEKGKNYELGLKGEWFDGRLNASAAVFETRKDNLAVYLNGVYTPDGDYAYSAEDGTKGRGWELEVSGELAPGWQLQGGYARIVTRDASGGLLNSTAVPKHSFKLFTTWKPAAVKGLTVGGGVQWQSEIYTIDEGYYSAAALPLLRQKSYAVASLLAQYRFDDHWHLSVNLNNVFNKTYRTSTYYHDYGAPRNLQATLRYQF